MKRLKIIGACILCLVLFTGCGVSRIRSGEIYEKQFVKEKTWVQMVPIVHVSGKMTWTSFMPITHHHPDEYKIYIRAYNAETQEYDTAVYYTTKECYEASSIGMWFECDDGRDLSEEPVTKTR